MKLNPIRILLPLLLITSIWAVTEYELKSVFIERFTRFIIWPVELPDEITIGVVGSGRSLSSLEALFSRQKIKDRSVNIVHIKEVEELLNCQIVFVEDERTINIATVLSTIDRSPILTIGDNSRDYRQGLMISFQMEGQNIRFSINHLAAKAVDFEMDSFFLNMAQHVLGHDRGRR